MIKEAACLAALMHNDSYTAKAGFVAPLQALHMFHDRASLAAVQAASNAQELCEMVPALGMSTSHWALRNLSYIREDVQCLRRA